MLNNKLLTLVAEKMLTSCHTHGTCQNEQIDIDHVNKFYYTL